MSSSNLLIIDSHTGRIAGKMTEATEEAFPPEIEDGWTSVMDARGESYRQRSLEANQQLATGVRKPYFLVTESYYEDQRPPTES